MRHLALAERAAVVELPIAARLHGVPDLVPPDPERLLAGGLTQVEPAVVPGRARRRVVDRRYVLAQQHPSEPVPLDLREVLHETEQREW
jgi:hypothetical protein